VIRNNRLINLFQKYKEIIVFGFFGGLTTLVNIAVYAAARGAGLAIAISVSAAWVISVSFAFFTNRKWVFKSRAKGIQNVLLEGVRFFSVRAGTYFLDIGIMWLFVDYLKYDGRLQELAIKLASNILVIIANYILSRFVVFKKS
jgi:putative flippase GtrA